MIDLRICKKIKIFNNYKHNEIPSEVFYLMKKKKFIDLYHISKKIIKEKTI